MVNFKDMKEAIFTSQAAAIGWVNFSPIYFEDPASRDIYIGCIFNIDYLWGSGPRNAKIIGAVSTVESCLEHRKSKIHLKTQRPPFP